MDKKQLKKDTLGMQNKFKLYFDFPLYDKAGIYANDTSKERGKFPQNRKGMERPSFNKIWENRSTLKLTFKSVFESIKLIKKFDRKGEYKSITKQEFDDMIKLFDELGMDQVGYTKITEKDVFKHLGEYLGVPYEHIIIFTARQNKEKVLTSPSMDSQIAVAETYGTTGNAGNVVSKYLDGLGYGAFPSHSLGGVIDYTKIAYKANLGHIGRHGLLINPVGGSNSRIGAIYTNIDNLGDYLNNNDDHTWIEDFCSKCGKCIRKCPSKAIYEETTVDQHGHVTSIDYDKCNIEFGSKFGCNICVAVCPFTLLGYDKLKSKFVKH